jgi:hypothetical protein
MRRVLVGAALLLLTACASEPSAPYIPTRDLSPEERLLILQYLLQQQGRPAPNPFLEGAREGLRTLQPLPPPRTCWTQPSGTGYIMQCWP